ncbi:MAG TPA: hypothetical protein VFW77_03670 [Candidatus Saccharimonadales bacterium]|nr:hypothetical protein [Candidatus Saccharimonadales bacterium]
MKLKAAWNRVTQDNKGRTIIWQWPNKLLIGWVLLRIASHFLHAGSLKNGFGFLGNAFLFTWAYLEIIEGASYFRRFLGTAVIIAVTVGYFMS